MNCAIWVYDTSTWNINCSSWCCNCTSAWEGDTSIISWNNWAVWFDFTVVTCASFTVLTW